MISKITLKQLINTKGHKILYTHVSALNAHNVHDVHVSTPGGEWVTAYQVEQRNRLRTVLRDHSQCHKIDSRSEHLRPPTNTREASGGTQRVLDKAFLMRHCFVEQPTDLSDGDISGVHLTTVRALHGYYSCTCINELTYIKFAHMF